MRQITQVERQLYFVLNKTADQNVLCVNLRLLLIHCFNIQNQSEKTAAYSDLVKGLYEKDQFFQRTFPDCTYQTLLDITSRVDPVLAKPLIAAVFSNKQPYLKHFLQQIGANKPNGDWYTCAPPETQQFIYTQMISLLIERHQLMVTTVKSLLERRTALNEEGAKNFDATMLQDDCNHHIRNSQRQLKYLRKLDTTLPANYRDYQIVNRHSNYLAGVHDEINTLIKRWEQLDKGVINGDIKSSAQEQKTKNGDTNAEIKEKHLDSKVLSSEDKYQKPKHGVIGDGRHPNLFNQNVLEETSKDNNQDTTELFSVFSPGFYNGI